MPFLSPSAFATAMPSVMPMSSTVWCASISRSPFARTSRSSATRTCVSFVSRWISALRMSGGHGGECVDQPRILLGRPDGEPQAVDEQGMRPMEVADQYTTLPEALEGAGRIAHAREDEVRRGGERLDAGDRGERAR